MEITVRYATQARQATGRAAESLALAGPCSVRDVLVELARRHGTPLGRILFDGPDAHAALLLFVGDEQVADFGQFVQAGDVLTILPPVAGG